MRKYESGSRWAVWRWTTRTTAGGDYLRRLHLFKAPWFAVMLHWIYRADPQPDPHDHPVSFLSVVLRGGYDEWTPGDPCHRVRRINWIPYNYVHRITRVMPGTLTLCVNGPPRHRWGFYTPGGKVDWQEYRWRDE